MVLESNKFKKRLIVIFIIILISSVFGTIAEKENKKYADQVDSIIETIQAIPEEDYSEEIKNAKIENEVTNLKTKEEALAVMQEIQAFYGDIFKYSEILVIILFTLAFSGSLIGVMMYYIFTGWIIQKIFPDLKKWMSVLMRILILILLFSLLFYILVTIGVFGQIPYIIYTLYKFIKTKRTEDKGDIIAEQ